MMIRRRDLLLSFGVAQVALAAPRTVRAQTGPLPRVGVLTTEPGPVHGAFVRALAAVGLEDGRSMRLDVRFHRGSLPQMQVLAAELATLPVDVMAVVGGAAVRAARQATRDIPIVFAIVVDPVVSGAVADRERPEANATGVTTFDPDLPRAQMQMLKQVVPQLSRVAALHEVGLLEALPSAYAAAAKAEGLRLEVIRLRTPTPDLEADFATIRDRRAQAMIAFELPVVGLEARRIADMAAAERLPTLYPRAWVGRGGLLCFGPSLAGATPLMARMIERILKGARPGDMPVETVTQHGLVVDLRIARVIGVTIPPAVLARAEQVIE